MADDWDEDRTSPLSGSLGHVYVLTERRRKGPTPKSNPIGFIHFPDRPKQKPTLKRPRNKPRRRKA